MKYDLNDYSQMHFDVLIHQMNMQRDSIERNAAGLRSDAACRQNNLKYHCHVCHSQLPLQNHFWQQQRCSLSVV